MTNRYPFAVIKEKLLAARGDAIDFAIGQRPVPLPQAIRDWVDAHAELALVPSNRVEMDEFSRVAADFLVREYGLEMPADRIVPTPGGRAAMSALIACAVQPGDRVAVTEPGYPAFARLAAHKHAKVVEMQLDPAEDFAPDISAAATYDDPTVRVVSINYPNNPTGTTLSPAVVSRLRELCVPGTTVFNDATYGPLVFDSPTRSLLAEQRLIRPDVDLVELHTFSKLFPLGPVAVSFLAGSAQLMHDIATYSEFAWSPLSKMQLQATMLGLRDTDRLRELRGFFPAQVRALQATLRQLGFSPFPASAGVYALSPIPKQIAGRPVSSAVEAAERLFDEFDLAVVPLETTQHSYLRFSSLYRPEDLERLSELGDRLQLT